MKYQVLARKYRPKTFPDMMGQEHVLKALSNALESGRLHHAYLFTGTRGVGKTTVARVLAKALNCEQGISASPCGECPSCQEIEQGRFVDLIEVDAASRTKVEDTRELLDNVQYAPTRGRFKIYLIDEVHMLSGHSFNALLKTLEEPPPHVKFLLATTDPQKLPVTILSRCLQFNLKRLTIAQIEQQLQQILTAEAIPFAENVLKPLAIAADGSMRDALSLLDQSIAYSNGQPNLADVEAMLGSVQKDRIFELLTALANEDGKALIEQSRILAGQGIDVTTILAELISTLQRIALCQTVPDAVDDSLGDKQAIEQMAQAISPEDIQLYYQIALNGRKDLPFSPQPQGGFEMILIRMLAFKPAGSGNKQKIEAPKVQSSDSETRVQAMPKSVSVETATFTATEKKTAEITATAEIVAQQINKPAHTEPAAKTQLKPQLTSATFMADTVPDEFELPPVDAYGQDNFANPAEQEMPLFDTGAPLLGEAPKENTPTSDRVSEPEKKTESESQSLPQPQIEVVSEQEPVEKVDNVVETVAELPCVKEDGSALADYWHDLINRSEVKGLEQQLAKHCALINKTQQNGQYLFQLLLESVHKHLLNDKILNRLIEALQQVLGDTLRLDIKECQVQPEEQLLTPRRREIHEAEVLQQQAVESIIADPKVKMLVEAFGAKVREETIKPI